MIRFALLAAALVVTSNSLAEAQPISPPAGALDFRASLRLPDPPTPALSDEVLRPPRRTFHAWSALWAMGVASLVTGPFVYILGAADLDCVSPPCDQSGLQLEHLGIAMIAAGALSTLIGVALHATGPRRYLRALEAYERQQEELRATAW
ncbi:MAG: hypothetical protein AAF938_18850 [Myxococcota bacterium]